MSSFQEVEFHCIYYRDILVSGGWNIGGFITLCVTEVSSFS